MSVHSVTGSGSVVLPSAATSPAANVAPRPRTVEPLVELDKVTQLPLPPRFPWLSWLSVRLDRAAAPASPYGSVLPLGARIDQRV